MANYTLSNVEERNAENPDTFHIATLEERRSIKAGSYAKLIFLYGEEAERMWVEVTQECNDGKYKGTLANNPFVLSGMLGHGDVIEFGPEHVAVIREN